MQENTNTQETIGQETNSKKTIDLFLLRHGDTERASQGKHTGLTDVPLSATGRQQATKLKQAIAQINFSLVLVSPLMRAIQTATLAGFDQRFVVDRNLAEINYGDYEALTTAEIRQMVPDWTVWTKPCPNGETLMEAAARTAAVIQRAGQSGGRVAIVAHGHILRILASTWLELPPAHGQHLILNTSTISILTHEHETPAIGLWNAAPESIQNKADIKGDRPKQ